MTDPGSDSRVHFLDAQRRNRRASWRFSLFAVVTVAISGIPLSVIIAPLIFAAVLAGAFVVNAVAPLAPGTWRALRDIAFLLPQLWPGGEAAGTSTPLSSVAALLILPGALAMLIAWAWLRVLFRRAGVRSVVRRLGARELRPEVPEERQLANLVGELAVAAGVGPPRVLVVDSDAANATAVGLTVEGATVVVSRGLLDRLGRDEKQAVLAHVIGSVGNGDLRIATTILTVFATWGLLSFAIDAPFGPRSRAALRMLARVAAGSRRGTLAESDAESALDLLLGGAGQEHEDLMRYLDEQERAPRSLPYAVFVQLPMYLTLGVASVASKAAIGVGTLLVFGPTVALLWRARRRLADATAVELTRDPEALARAVRRLSELNTEVPGGTPVNFLFPVWSRSTDSNAERTDVMSMVLEMHLELDKRLAYLRTLGAWTGSPAVAPVPSRRERARALVAPFKDFAFLVAAFVGIVIALALLIAVHLATASCIFMAAWVLLSFAFVTAPSWVAERFGRGA